VVAYHCILVGAVYYGEQNVQHPLEYYIGKRVL